MIPRKLLDRALTPDKSGEVQLYQRGDDFFISLDGKELMSSRMHALRQCLPNVHVRPSRAAPFSAIPPYTIIDLIIPT